MSLSRYHYFLRTIQFISSVSWTGFADEQITTVEEFRNSKHHLVSTSLNHHRQAKQGENSSWDQYWYLDDFTAM